MQDGLAHIPHRERFPYLDVHDTYERRFCRVAAVDGQMDRRNRPSDVIEDVGIGHSGQRRAREQERCQGNPDQNECLTRNSIA